MRVLPDGFKGSPLRWRLEKWLWACMTLVWAAVYLFARPLFNAVSILYVICISHWALVLSAASTETAAEARDKADDGS